MCKKLYCTPTRNRGNDAAAATYRFEDQIVSAGGGRGLLRILVHLAVVVVSQKGRNAYGISSAIITRLVKVLRPNSTPRVSEGDI